MFIVPENPGDDFPTMQGDVIVLGEYSLTGEPPARTARRHLLTHEGGG
jgi:hypothetical protein